MLLQLLPLLVVTCQRQEQGDHHLQPRVQVRLVYRQLGRQAGGQAGGQRRQVGAGTLSN